MFVFQQSQTRFREHKKYDNGTDLGMKPGNGLESPHIALVDVEKGINKARSKFCSYSDQNGSKERRRKAEYTDVHVWAILERERIAYQ